jgi:hypothetical protein
MLNANVYKMPDSVIYFCFRHLAQTVLPTEDQARTHVFKCMFYEFLKNGQSLTHCADIFNKNFLIIPINSKSVYCIVSSIPLLYTLFSTRFHQLVFHPLTSSCRLFLGLPLSLVSKFIYSTFWEFCYLSFSVLAQTNINLYKIYRCWMYIRCLTGW